MANYFIDRPVFAWVIALFIILFGVIAIPNLPIARYPSVAPPSVSITASYPGATPQAMNDSVLSLIERELSGVKNLLYFESSSDTSGSASIMVTFKPGADPDMAQVDVQNKLKSIEPRLPQVVRQNGLIVESASSNFLMIIGLKSDHGRFSEVELSDYMARNMIDELRRIEGVGRVQLFGAEQAMRIWVDPVKLMAYGLTMADLSSAISQQNIQIAPGSIGAAPAVPGQRVTTPLTVYGQLTNPEEFAGIVLKASANGARVVMGDVARVELGAATYGFDIRENGKSATAAAIQLAPGANAVKTADAIKARLQELSKTLPAGMSYSIPFDTAPFVKISIEKVIHSLVEAMVLVFLVVYLFLQNWRATLIPCLAVPVSIVGTFAGMYLLGFSINTLTLFGMVLAIGIVVDDAIVVLENVERIMQEKKCSPKEAAILAMQEVSGPVVAIVLVLCAVFLPVAFMGGMTGVMYKQFAITVAVSVAISGLVALTLSPALCAVLLKEGHHKPARFFVWFNNAFDGLTRRYVRGVAFLNRRVGVAFTIIAFILVSIYGLLMKVPGERVPNEDQGYLLSAVMLPDAASLTRTQAVANDFDQMAMANPNVKDVITFSGFDILSNAIISNSGISFITLKDWSERQGAGQDSFSLAKTFQGMSLMGLADGFVASFNPPPITGMSTTGGLEAYLQNRSTGNAQAFSAEVQRFLEEAKQRPEFASVTSTYRANVPQVYLDLDREKAKALGLPINAVFDTMQATFGQVYVNDFNQFGRTYRVQLQSEADYRAKKSDIRNVYVRSDKGEMIPLSSLVTVRDATGPELVERFNIFQAAKIMAQPAPGYSSGQAIAALEAVADESLGNDAKLEWTGSAYQEKAAAGSAGTAFGFGIVMIFLILAAQYERWSLPFAVITAVPFALFGALLATWLVGLTNNVYFQIGLVTLVGLAAKNAILIVEFAVMKHEEGMSLIESALEAARLRFRPIVMTSLAFILGCVPLVTSSGAGAASRHALGWPVIGGMLAATFIAIFFIPLFFRLIMRRSERAGGKTAQPKS